VMSYSLRVVYKNTRNKSLQNKAESDEVLRKELRIKMKKKIYIYSEVHRQNPINKSFISQRNSKRYLNSSTTRKCYYIGYQPSPLGLVWQGEENSPSPFSLLPKTINFKIF
jgi:hypothetical protein